MGLNPKIGIFYPQNGWFISWKTSLKWDDLGGFNFPPMFWFNTHIGIRWNHSPGERGL